MVNNFENPFPDEFDKKDVIGKIDFDKESKASSGNVFKSEVIDLDLDSLEDYDEEVFKEKKFQNLSDLSFIDKISNIPNEFKQELSFRGINEDLDEEKMTDQEILRKDFKDFLILNKISGRLTGVPHTHKIPNEVIDISNKSIIIEDDPYISELDEKQKSSSVILHRNELDEIEFIEVLCTCGEKTVIKINYESSTYSMRPDATIHEDYDPNTTINAFDVTINTSNIKLQKTENNSENLSEFNDPV